MISEGQAGDTIHLVLAEGTDWHTPIQQLFNKHVGADWAVLVLELQSGSARFYVLSPHTKCTPKRIDSTVLWLVPLCTEPPAKPKLIKKVLVKKSPEKTPGPSGSTKITKSPTGTKIVRKKVVTKDGVTTVNSDVKEKSPAENNGVTKKASVEKSTKSRETAKKTERANGDGSGVDSGISLADSDNEKSQKTDMNAPEEDYRESDKLEASTNEWVTPCTTPDSALKAIETEATFVPKTETSQDGISTSFTMTLSNNEPMTSAKSETARMERIAEEEEKHCVNGPSDIHANTETTQSRFANNGSGDERYSPGLSWSSSRHSPPSDASDSITRIHQALSSERFVKFTKYSLHSTILFKKSWNTFWTKTDYFVISQTPLPALPIDTIIHSQVTCS